MSKPTTLSRFIDTVTGRYYRLRTSPSGYLFSDYRKTFTEGYAEQPLLNVQAMLEHQGYYPLDLEPCYPNKWRQLGWMKD